MDARHWLEEVRDKLAERKLPPYYVERLVEELSDHLHDFMEDPMSTDAQDLRGLNRHLGLPAELAAAAASEFRKQRFSRRHPVLIFVVMPIVALALLWIAAALLFGVVAGAISWLDGGRGERLPDWLIECLPVVVCGMVLGPIALAAALFCRIARRAAIGWKWPLSACLVLAIIGGVTLFDINVTGGGDGALKRAKFKRPSPSVNGQIMIGFGINHRPHPWQIVQFSVPLAICGCFIWRQASLPRQHVLAN